MFIVFSACLAMSASACITEPECDICLTSADVVGTVMADGQPLAGASVNAEVSSGACGSPGLPSFDGPVFTSVSGSYRVRASVSAPPGLRCVTIRITPPSGSGLQSRTDTVAALRFRPEWTGPAARDSARVDFALVTAP
jgi:hypothetical protein